jgi:hypothetical protein
MPLAAGCPRCSAPVTESAGQWVCGDHGATPPLWRPSVATYDTFGEHLKAAAGYPTYLPWPMSPGWHVTDFGVVCLPGAAARATVTAVAGMTPLDGAVEMLVVSEEPGTGLGARCAGTLHSDPGTQIAGNQPSARVRVDSQGIALWPISTHDADAVLDRSVFAGEAAGRWLWLVLRPASAMLLLAAEWVLADVSGFGAELLETPFGGNPPAW